MYFSMFVCFGRRTGGWARRAASRSREVQLWPANGMTSEIRKQIKARKLNLNTQSTWVASALKVNPHKLEKNSEAVLGVWLPAPLPTPRALPDHGALWPLAVGVEKDLGGIDVWPCGIVCCSLCGLTHPPSIHSWISSLCVCAHLLRIYESFWQHVGRCLLFWKAHGWMREASSISK